MSSKVFELLDDKIDSEIKASQSFLWEEHFREGNFISIPKLLDEKSDVWKNRYLQWTYELATSIEEGQELYKHFQSQLIQNESFWWQSLIADKCPYKSKSPYLVIKLWILEELYTEGNYDQLIYRGKDKKLARVLSDWLEKNNLGKFLWQKTKENKFIGKSYLLDNLPTIVLGIVPLVKVIIRKLRYPKEIKIQADSKLTIITYFPGIDADREKKGVFYSNYWGPLNDYIQELRMPVNWIWIYSKQQFNFNEAVNIQQRLNSKSDTTRSSFRFMENNLDFTSLFSVLKEYICISLKGYLIKKRIKEKFTRSGSKVNFFPIISKEWADSFWGHSAMMNYLIAASFKNLQLSDSTKIVLYVWENQPWEQSLLAQKKIFPNVKFYGSVHTPANASLLNLKVFPGNKEELEIKNGRKFPDYICAPSNIARKVLIEGGWPSSHVIVTEALRYIESLKNFDAQQIMKEGQLKTLLVVTGSIRKEVYDQLKILVEFEKNFGVFFDKVIIKPHPLIPVEGILENLGKISNVEITHSHIKNLWEKSSIIYTANSTSVGLEAYYLGLPLVILGANGNFNLNALLGTKDVCFIHTSFEFSNFLFNYQEDNKSYSKSKEDLFSLDKNIPKWKEILS